MTKGTPQSSSDEEQDSHPGKLSTQSQVDCGQLETCESLCCQDTLDLYQEKDPASLKTQDPHMVKGTDSSVLIGTILIHGLFCALHERKHFVGFAAMVILAGY